METTRKTPKAATWMGFFLGEGAVRSHPTGLRYIPRWVLKRFLNRAGSWTVFLGRLLPYTLSTNRAPLCNNTKPTVHTPPEDGFFSRGRLPRNKNWSEVSSPRRTLHHFVLQWTHIQNFHYRSPPCQLDHSTKKRGKSSNDGLLFVRSSNLNDDNLNAILLWVVNTGLNILPPEKMYVSGNWKRKAYSRQGAY